MWLAAARRARFAVPSLPCLRARAALYCGGYICKMPRVVQLLSMPWVHLSSSFAYCDIHCDLAVATTHLRIVVR